MLRLVAILSVCFTSFLGFSQAAPKYQVGTITEVRTHQGSAGASDVTSYDVSVKVGGTIYVVLYTPPLREDAVKYAAGRDLLVLVAKNTIRYNDILGRSFDVPIESEEHVVIGRGSEVQR